MLRGDGGASGRPPFLLRRPVIASGISRAATVSPGSRGVAAVALGSHWLLCARKMLGGRGPSRCRLVANVQVGVLAAPSSFPVSLPRPPSAPSSPPAAATTSQRGLRRRLACAPLSPSLQTTFP
uniref:Uncharacterized protein n=1 Tax=Oryza nivara TaxID=4536 RepID=A0A0E0GGH1_ORYNI